MNQQDNRKPLKEKYHFIEHLKYASMIVKTWPVWKQKILGGTSSRQNKKQYK